MGLIARFSRLPLAFLLVVLFAFPLVAGRGRPDSTDGKYAAKQVFDDSFSLQQGGQLDLNVNDMDVVVRVSDDERSHVTVFVASPHPERANEYFEAHQFEAEGEGNTLTIRSPGPHHRPLSFWKRYRNVRVWAIVSVPSKIDAKIHTDDGDVWVDELDGIISLDTGDGDIEVGVLRGTVTIRSSDGDLSIGEIDAGRVSLRTSDGDIRADRIQGDDVMVHSSDGDVNISDIHARATVAKTSDGNIRIGVSGDRLEVTTSDGDVEIEFKSEIEAELRTHDGDITLSLPHALGAELNLRAEDVSMSGSKTMLHGTVSENRIVGKLNDGGPMLRAKADDGTISLRLRR